MKAAQEKIDLIKEWSLFFLKNTESWECNQAGNLGSQIAYLLMSIAIGKLPLYEYFEDEEIIKILREHNILDTSSIWNYIVVLKMENKGE